MCVKQEEQLFHGTDRVPASGDIFVSSPGLICADYLTGKYVCNSYSYKRTLLYSCWGGGEAVSLP